MKSCCILLLSILSICRLYGQQALVDATAAVAAHPRLLMREDDAARIREAVRTDAHWKEIHAAILGSCDSLLRLAPSERVMGGIRLDPNRLCLYRIFYLCYAWRITREEKYFIQAEKELMAISHFSDWNPSHYLDVAELTMAAAIGYDWLYPALPEAERQTVRQAILTKGILTSYDSSYHAYRKWLSVTNNWNQVCNTGISYGAMAIYESDPAFARQVINRSLESIVISMKDYDPDGAYAEGYGYWSYGTTYNVFFINGLLSMFGRDFGLGDRAGFLKSAGYLENMTGPTGQCFNYSDVSAHANLQPAMFWFSRKMGDPSLLWEERGHMSGEALRSQLGYRFLPAVLIWGAGINMSSIAAPKARFWTGRGRNPVALMRSSWTDPAAVFVGLKGGSPAVTHGHMDAGSFVMEADGVRWAMDFGYQDYASLESRNIDLWDDRQDGARWKIFRYNNFTHNTLTVNGGLQVVKGSAPITGYTDRPGFMSAVTDLSGLYKGSLAAAQRGIALCDGQYVVVRDEVSAGDSDVVIRWSMVTPATVRMDGPNRAELSCQGKKMELVVEGTGPVTMQTWTSDPPPQDYDSPNPGTVIVGFVTRLAAHQKGVYTVFLMPGKVKAGPNKPIKSLEEWK